MYIFAHTVLLPQVEFLEVELMDYVSVFFLLIPGDSGLHSYQLHFRVLSSSDPQQLYIIYLNLTEKNRTSTEENPKPYTSFAIHYHFYLSS